MGGNTKAGATAEAAREDETREAKVRSGMKAKMVVKVAEVRMMMQKGEAVKEEAARARAKVVKKILVITVETAEMVEMVRVVIEMAMMADDG